MSRYPQSYQDHAARKDALGSARTLDSKLPTDLANRMTQKVNVSCMLAPEAIIWGKYGDDPTAIMHLKLRSTEPPGYKLRYFKVDLRFAAAAAPTNASALPSVVSPAPSASSHSPTPSIHSTQPASASASTSALVSLPQSRVWLPQTPSPSPLPEYIEGRPWSETQNRGVTVDPSVNTGAGGGRLGSFFRTTEKSVFFKWQFRSYPDPDENNHPTTATWIWEANKINPQVENRGVLHAAVVLCHSGTELSLECNVKGKLCQGHLFSKFGTKKSKPALWRREPGPSTDDVKAHLDELKTKLNTLNMVAPARKSPGEYLRVVQ